MGNIRIITILILFLTTTLLAQNSTCSCVSGALVEEMSLRFTDVSRPEVIGSLVRSDASYFLIHNHSDNSYEVIPRIDIDYVEANLNVDLRDVQATANPGMFKDVIELNDGSKISCIILDIGSDFVQCFIGNSMKRQLVSANSIYMVYMNNADTSIPFPVSPSYAAVL